MEIKSFYYEEVQKVVISDFDEKPEYENLSGIHLIVDLKETNIENIYDFFRRITVKAILEDIKEIKYDFSEIESENFFEEDNFKSMIDLLESLRCDILETIEELDESPEDEN